MIKISKFNCDFKHIIKKSNKHSSKIFKLVKKSNNDFEMLLNRSFYGTWKFFNLINRYCWMSFYKNSDYTLYCKKKDKKNEINIYI